MFLWGYSIRCKVIDPFFDVILFGVKSCKFFDVIQFGAVSLSVGFPARYVNPFRGKVINPFFDVILFGVKSLTHFQS